MEHPNTRVGIALFDGAEELDWAGPWEVLSYWSRYKPEDHIEVFTVARDNSRPIECAKGLRVLADHSWASAPVIDVLVVPGGSGTSVLLGDDEVRAWLRSIHERARLTTSVCTGAFLLAEAGLLDGKVATTHWLHAAELARRYPRVKVDPKVLYIDAGDVLTSAGTSAGIDLCLHVVRQDHGAEVANAVARRMVVPPHRDGGQAQFVDAPVPGVGPGHGLAATLEWAVAHLDEELSVERLARQARMSPRTFARRFRSETGTTPLQWIVAQRVIAAQRLLETTDLSIDRVAGAVGFGSAVTLRQHFARALGTAPTAYRQTFRASA